MSTTTLRRQAAPIPSRGDRVDPEAPAGARKDLLNLVQVVRTIRKRPIWPIAGTFLGVVVGLVLMQQNPELYEATTRVLITNSAASKLGFNPKSHARSSAVRLNDEALRLRDDDVLNLLIRDLNLLSPGLDPASAALRRSQLLRQLHNSIMVRVVPETSILSISFASLSPSLSARVVNKLVQEFTQLSYQTRFEDAQRAAQWPAGQLAQLKAEVQATQTEMNQVQQRLGNTGFASEYNREDKSLDALTRSAVEARVIRDQAQAQYQSLSNLDPVAQAAALDALPATPPLALLSPMQSRVQSSASADAIATRGRLHDAQAELAMLSASLGPSHPARRATQAQVATLQAQADATRLRHLQDLRNRLLLARCNADAADAALTGALAKAYGEGADTILYRKLLREFTFTRALYVRLYGRLRNGMINTGLGSVQVQVLDAAQIPPRPIPSMHWLLLSESILGGFLFGAALSLALENFRSGFRSIDEVEAVTDLPSLAALPHLQLSRGLQFDAMSTAGRNLMAIEQPSSPFTESLRILRLNLDLSGTGPGLAQAPRYILFTSSTPSEGKTTVAGNYAVVLAERGERVLLIDADMHRPNLHHRFGLSGRRGLSNALSGQCPWQNAVQPIPEAPNLDLLVAGPVPPSPAALLAGPALLSLLRQAGRTYTHIVLDSPPVMAVNDGILLSQLVDAVVFVVRSGKIDKRIVRLGRERLSRSGAPLAGIVLNGITDASTPHTDRLEP